MTADAATWAGVLRLHPHDVSAAFCALLFKLRCGWPRPTSIKLSNESMGRLACSSASSLAMLTTSEEKDGCGRRFKYPIPIDHAASKKLVKTIKLLLLFVQSFDPSQDGVLPRTGDPSLLLRKCIPFIHLGWRGGKPIYAGVA